MKKGIVLVYLWVFITASNYAQNYAVSHIPEALMLNAKSVVRDRSINFIVKDESHSSYLHKEVITYLDKKDDDFVLSFAYSDLRKIENISVKLYDKDGKLLKTYKKKDFRDIVDFDYSTFYSNMRTMYLSIKVLAKPFTIETEIEWAWKYRFDYPDYHILSIYQQSVEKSSYTIQLPKETEIVYKNINTDLPVTTIRDSRYDHYSWQVENLPAIEYQPYQDPRSIQSKIIISGTNFIVDKVPGGMRTWSDYAKFTYDLNKDTRNLTPEITALANELVKEATSNREKILAIYNHVKNKMRYVNVMLGIGGFKAHDIQYVHKNSFGDCKALTNYTMALLSAVGIESHWALIYRGSDDDPLIVPDIASQVFNHVILYIPEENLWLECTSKNLPLGYIGADNMDKLALLIKGGGGELFETPQSSSITNGYFLDAQVNINTDASAQIDLKIDYEGSSHDPVRYYVDNLNEKDKSIYFQDYIDITPQQITALDFQYAHDSPFASIKSSFDTHKIGSFTGNRLFLGTNTIDRLQLTPRIDTLKAETFILKSSFVDEVLITYTLPETFKIENLPYSTIERSTPFFDYVASLHVDEGNIISKRRCQFKPGTFAREIYPDYLASIRELSKHEKARIVLVKK